MLGIDDSPFQFKDERALVVGVMMRLPAYVEGVLKMECEVDGRDANSVLAENIINSRFKDQIKLIMVDGIALCGFNVIDITELYEETGIPCATVTRDSPDRQGIRTALEKHFDDWKERWAIIERQTLYRVSTDHKPVHVAVEGMTFDQAEELIRKSTVRGAIPEPLRVAHLIATAIVTGESAGRS